MPCVSGASFAVPLLKRRPDGLKCRAGSVYICDFDPSVVTYLVHCCVNVRLLRFALYEQSDS